MSAEVDAPIGRVTLNEAAYRRIFDVLAEGPRSIAELEQAAGGAVSPAELAGVLCMTRQGTLVVDEAAVDASAPRALNRFIAADLLELRDDRPVYVAAPVIGGGLPLVPLEFLVFRALIDGMSGRADIVAWVARALAARGERMIRDGKPIEDEAENLRVLGEVVETIVTGTVPVWRRLGVL
jgi:hypothetical protein